MNWLAIAIGGAVGSLARHAVNLMAATPSTRFPVGTAVVNLVGCLLIGLLAGLLVGQRIHLSSYWREFIFVGVLGGFTTFSTFGLDTFMLSRTHSPWTAGANVLVQVAGGLLAVWAGYQLGVSNR